jgi:hypothetical protein
MRTKGLIQRSAAVRLNLNGQLLVLVEEWRRSQPQIPSRTAAIRQLIGHALSSREQRTPPARDSQWLIP